MPNIRPVISVIITCSFLCWLLIFSGVEEAHACIGPPPPKTLLELYLTSDLVVLAEIESENFIKIRSASDDFVNVDVRKDFTVLDTFKGAPEKHSSLQLREMRPNNAPANTRDWTGSFFFYEADFRDLPFIAAGRRYVLFLNWNEDHGSYRLTDYSSGAREIDRNNPNFLPARVHELARILQEPEGQSRELTAWLVDLTGNPRTRYDGVYDLLKNSLRYDLFSSPSENPDTRHLDMVRNLEDPDDTQRSRIGDAAYKQISQYMSDDRYFDRHRTMELLAAHAVKWDSERFADRAFELLQTTRQTTISKIEILMRSISGASHDPSLTGIYHEWGEAMLRKSEVDEKCREIIARFLARYRDIKGGRSSSDPR